MPILRLAANDPVKNLNSSYIFHTDPRGHNLQQRIFCVPEKIFSNRSKLKRRGHKFSFNLRTYIVVDFPTHAHLSPRISALVFDRLQNFLVVRKRVREISSAQRLGNLYYRQTVTRAYRGSANFFVSTSMILYF